MNINEFKRDKEGRIIIDDKKCKIDYLPTQNNTIKFFLGNDEKRYFCKCDSLVSMSDFEIFASYLADYVGLNAVKYYPAVFKVDGVEFNSVICEDFTKNGKYEKIKSSWLNGYSNMQNTVENQLFQIESETMRLSHINNQSYYFDKRKIKNDLTKLLIFDFCTLQSDRERRNIEYLIKDNKDKKEIVLAPVFDNSVMLGSDNMPVVKQIFENIKQNKSLPDNIFDDKVFKFGINKKMDYKGVAKEIKNMQLLNPYAKSMIEKFKNVDYNQIKNQIEKDNPGYKLPQSICDMAKKVIEKTSSALSRQTFFEF